MISTGPATSGSTTIADGADIAQGSTTDAAVITDTTGTISGKFRGLVKWAFERMPAALGQTTMAASLPVTLANNQSNVGVALPVQWSVTHTPAAATQATIGKAAGAAGVKHVCTSISFTFCAVAAAPAAAAPMTVNLRDGTTGAGTILWSQIINIPAVAGESRQVNLGGLTIVGTAATAMTLEFAAAGAANTQQSVSVSGYDV